MSHAGPKLIVIGLSVVLTQKSKNNSAEMGALAALDGSSVYSDFEEGCSSSSGKSGKSGGSGDKSRGGKSGKNGGSCRLVVPGTEDYEKVEINSGTRRHLKADMDMTTSNSPTYFPTSTGLSDILDKSDESRDGSSGKSGKSGGSSGESNKSGGHKD